MVTEKSAIRNIHSQNVSASVEVEVIDWQTWLQNWMWTVH